jgi:hypothetical protein
MNKWILVLVGMIMIGCSKNGAKSHLMDGAQAPESTPTLVDHNLPGPDGNPAP